jgi:hypothetical protein
MTRLTNDVVRYPLMLAVAGLALAGPAGTSARADTIAWDSMTGVTNTFFFPGSPGRSFVGQALSLDSSAPLTLTGFDTILLSGAAQTGLLRLNVFVWGGFSPTASPVFSNLLYTESFNFNSISLALNGFYPLESSTAGVPGFRFTTPVALPASSPVGITLNWQINTGAGFVNTDTLTTAVRASVPLAVGTNLNGTSPNFGFFRNASGQTNGNFLPTDGRSVGANSAISLRLYTVPTPGAAALLGLGGLLASRRRRA